MIDQYYAGQKSERKRILKKIEILRCKYRDEGSIKEQKFAEELVFAILGESEQ